MLVQVDSGGANDHREWGWEVALQRLADEFGVAVTHYPPGASKWNPIEHRLFSAIRANWAGEPLVTYETIRKYIRTTRTATGLRCRADLDRAAYPAQRRATPAEKAWVCLERRAILPRWHYVIRPHRQTDDR